MPITRMTPEQQIADSSADDLLQESRDQRISRYNKQLLNAAVSGMLKGSLFGLTLGFLLSYRYNHPPYTRFFTPTRMVFWLVGWNVIGVTWSTDVAKVSLTRQAALEHEIKRNLLLEKELATLNAPVGETN